MSRTAKVFRTTNTPNVEGVGTIRYADGSSWNPGQGEGYYYWNGDYWSFMGSIMGGTSGWRDLVGNVSIRGSGPNDPSWTTWRGNIPQYQFSNVIMNQMVFEWHLQHDYKPGSDIYLHVHWSQNVSDPGKAAKWYWEVTYAKGYQQAAFIVPITTSVVQNSDSTAYEHMIAEVQLSAASPSASQLDSDDLEVDGLIIGRLYRDPTDPADTLTSGPFVHYSDIHYQVDRLATKNRNYPFYT